MCVCLPSCCFITGDLNALSIDNSIGLFTEEKTLATNAVPKVNNWSVETN